MNRCNYWEVIDLSKDHQANFWDYNKIIFCFPRKRSFAFPQRYDKELLKMLQSPMPELNQI